MRSVFRVVYVRAYTSYRFKIIDLYYIYIYNSSQSRVAWQLLLWLLWDGTSSVYSFDFTEFLYSRGLN